MNEENTETKMKVYSGTTIFLIILTFLANMVSETGILFLIGLLIASVIADATRIISKNLSELAQGNKSVSSSEANEKNKE